LHIILIHKGGKCRVKAVQLHDRVFDDRVSETEGEEEKEGTFLKQEANNCI
jgi:hypothetical protein